MVLNGKGRHFVVGANHHSSTASVRERLFIAEDRTSGILNRLRGVGLNQALLLSTCARTEVQGIHDDPDLAATTVTGLLAEFAGLDVDELSPQLYAKEDEDAVRHVFSVVSSLDSPVVGEPQVAGQVRESHRLAREAGMVGPELNSLLSAAYSVAKRVRTETAVSERPVSMAAVASMLAQNVHGDLARCAGLLIVSGDMGDLIAERLLADGLGRLIVTSPVTAIAEFAARRYGSHHAPFDTLPRLIDEADVVISSLGSGAYPVTAEIVSAALVKRRRKPIFLIDAAIPGDVHPAVDELDGAFRYDLDDLERVAMQGVASRDAAATAAHDIIETEVEGYFRQVAGRSAAPVLTALRGHFEEVRAQVLVDKQGAGADEVTRTLINRLLHAPSNALRRVAEEGGDGGAVERVLRQVFGLSPDIDKDEQ